MSISHHKRKIRSFVKREGRLTKGQRVALETQWPIFGLSLDDGQIDIEKLFDQKASISGLTQKDEMRGKNEGATAVYKNIHEDGDRIFNKADRFSRKSSTTLEIGFGMGHSLLTQAQQHPEHNFIGIEVHKPGVGTLLREMQLNDVTNIRVYDCDAVDVLKQCIIDNSLDTIQIFFPDPWHKKRHHKRRLIQKDFIELLQKKLKSGGTLHLATDWENYAEHMMDVMNESASFKNVAGHKQYSPRPGSRPITKFEKRGLKLGHGVWDLIFIKEIE